MRDSPAELRRLCTEFGLSPVARTRLAIKGHDDGDDPFADLVRQDLAQAETKPAPGALGKNRALTGPSVCRASPRRAWFSKPGFPFWPWHGHRIHPRCAEYHVFSR